MNSSKAAVCVVDLTRRDESDDILLRKSQIEDKDHIKENEEEEGTHMKNTPNVSN